MRFYFTKHAKEKFSKVKRAGFPLTKNQVKDTVQNPVRVENKPDDTFIATKILDSAYILRVVYREEDDIIVIITFYPARRKDYKI